MSSSGLAHTQGRKRCTDKLPVGAAGFGPASTPLTYIQVFSPHSHMVHRVRGRGSVLLLRGTLVKDNGLCVGQAEPVGPHDF